VADQRVSVPGASFPTKLSTAGSPTLKTSRNQRLSRNLSGDASQVAERTGGPEALASIAQVVIDAPQHAGLASVLDYRSERSLEPGALVRVPLGRREVAGIVWRGLAARRDSGVTLRGVTEVLEAITPLGPRWMALVEFAASYYQRSTGHLPPGLRAGDTR